VWQRQSEITQRNWQELGINVTLEGRQLIPSINDVFDDARTMHLLNTNLTANTARHDAHELLNTFRTDFAGANGLPNWTNYANCDLSEMVINQRQEGDTEVRRGIVNEAYRHISEQYLAITTITDPIITMYYPERIDVGGAGVRGFSESNFHSLIQTSSTDGEPLTVGSTFPGWTSRNPFTMGNELALLMWNNAFYSPLVARGPELELQSVLAEDWDIEDQSQLFRFHLADATFHDGSQVTADDVKFTFALYHNNAAELTKGAEFPFESSPEESITVVDDTTVEFRFDSPHPVFVQGEVPRYGIWSRDHVESEGFAENPASAAFQEFIGSGPFELSNFQVQQRGTLIPVDDHPAYSPDTTYNIRTFDEQNTLFSAFEAQEIDIASRGLPDQVLRLQEEMGDQFETVTGANIHPGNYFAQWPFGPVKFQEFRNAIGTALNRQQIAEVATGGFSDPVLASLHIAPIHPWYPEEDSDVITNYTDDPTGDIEGARQILEDAGWGWDGNGNLRYPANADLSPHWPEGEMPSLDEFACIDGDGELTF
jgi:peptide/nickel transport system substrate-binding protein